MTLFSKIFIWDETFCHLLQNLELALKFKISDTKANLSCYHLQLKVLDKILLLRYKWQQNNNKSMQHIYMYMYLPLCGIEHFIDSHLNK